VTQAARERAIQADGGRVNGAMPSAKIIPEQFEELARLAVRGNLSHRGLGQHFGVDSSTITRTLRKPAVAALLDIEREREGSARRSKEYRDRRKEREQTAATAPDTGALYERLTGRPPNTADRISIDVKRPNSDGVLVSTGVRVIVRRNGSYWRETATCGYVPARRADFEDHPVPADFEDGPRYGPPDAPPREPVGYVEPSCRMRHPSPSGRTMVESPVPLSEQVARLQDGWELVS
jgi:hypothetical protein